MQIAAASIAFLYITTADAFWDEATTTHHYYNEDIRPRQSFFRWMWVVQEAYRSYFINWDWDDLHHRRQLNSVVGISIDMLPINTGALLNQRTVITSANALAPYMNRQKDLRIWALGNTKWPISFDGFSNNVFLTTYRYRVWRVRRFFPRSLNPEHWHGPRGEHQPLHDVTIVHSMDQIFISGGLYPPTYSHQPWKAYLAKKDEPLKGKFRMTGTGYMDMAQVKENYKIVYNTMVKADIVDCSIYLPKWWGKFICFKNLLNLTGVPNGGPMYTGDDFGIKEYGYKLVGLGCFEIRYNDDKIMVFTDLRYYMDLIHVFANITPLEYYEYAYPDWGYMYHSWWDGWTSGSIPRIPALYPQTANLMPLGRR